MKWLKRLLFLLLLSLFVSQPLLSQNYKITEEELTQLEINFKELEKEILKLNRQLLMQSEEHKKALNQLEDSQNSLKIAQESLTKLETEKVRNKITTITISIGVGVAIGMIGSYFIFK